MHYKRQTVWIVSMLSLMVVLSAYYLFTDDVNEWEMEEFSWDQQANVGNAEKDAKDVVSEPVDLEEQGMVEEQTDESAAGQAEEQTDEPASGQSGAKTEQEVLKQLESQQQEGSYYFAEEQMKRNEAFSRETERLLSIITDENQNSEAISKAYEELRKLEDQEAKLTNLQEMLMKDFPNALVKEEDNKWKVVVQANKLEKSEAVSIVDTVVKEMGVEPWQIVVQYRP